ncbi:D-alanyl-D-alanine carboxypeptidase family protein [Rhodovulum sp. 12E13]|uniref:D-alanyl-D-alanine carboxypeptidase family protein n=1 Tax=Rhodovulum sp. 12E13 TaxID=2203891 RepID=UPI001F4502BF|nr:D-alanyl-D-alanine carboxypeptidase family protein [Rhodovulum sp. 12E13]
MSTPAPQGRRGLPAHLYPIVFALLTLAVLLGASLRAGAAPYAAMVMDARTGEVLHSANADTRLHPASLTKMMTLYIAFEAVQNGEIGLDDMVTISRKAAAEVPSKLGLRAGSRIELRYLIRAAAVKSANDAATAIGEAIEGSEAAFARRMTRTAKALGMTRTTFKNAHGLTEEGHLSTARDMTIMGRRLFYDYPQYYNLFSRQSTSAKLATVYNTNRRFLAAYKGADGIKTGYTRAAGFNLVASAERGDRRIIATVFGGNSTASRNKEVARLLDIGFDRAPRFARVRKPAPPDYAAVAALPPSGPKVVRVVQAVPTSLRPRPRPAPAGQPGQEAAGALVATLQDGIEAAVAEALDAGESPAAAGLAEAVASAAAGPAAQTLAALSPVPRPDDLVPADLGSEELGPDGPDRPSESGATEIAAAPDTAPEASPASNSAAVPADNSAQPVRVAAGGVVAGAAATVPVSAAAPAPARPSAGLAAAASRAAEEAAPRAVSFLRSSPAPAPRPAATADTPGAAGSETAVADAADAAVREVIARVSTSGGRHWGITLGRYPSRFAAERELLRTALSEMSALDGGLRKVAREPGGFRANFVGLSEEQAAIACRRLSARGRPCDTLGPS